MIRRFSPDLQGRRVTAARSRPHMERECGDQLYPVGVGGESKRERFGIAVCGLRELQQGAGTGTAVQCLESGFEAAPPDPVAAAEIADEVAPTVDSRVA